MFFTPLPNCNYLVHSIFRYNDEWKSLARKVASLLFSSLLLVAGTSQIAFNISNLIKLSFRKKNLKFAVLLTRYNHIFRFTTNLIRSEKHLRIRLIFTRCKFISWNVINLLVHFGSNVVFHTSQYSLIIKKPMVFWYFQGV